MKDSINIVHFRAVANTLRELNQTVVFVGGATVSLYAGKAAPESRPTDDVDVIVELASYGEYEHLEDRLRSVGFVNDTESGVVCRYKIHGLTVDIMPTHPVALGFNNRWYSDGLKRPYPTASTSALPSISFRCPISLPPSPKPLKPMVAAMTFVSVPILKTLYTSR
jgi:hypothetical protein